MNEISKFKKGDEVYWVRMGADQGVANVWAVKVVLQSWGKKQAWALRNVNGKALRQRIYTDSACTVVLRTQAEVEQWAAANAPAYAEQSRLGSLRCEEVNFHNLYMHLRPAAQARIDALKNKQSSYIITYS